MSPGGRAPALVIRTLGAAEARIDAPGADDDRFVGPGKPLALLIWLAGVAKQTCRREQMLDLLWSDADPEQGRHALRQTVFYLRRRLHDRVIHGTRDSLTLGLPVRSDHELLLAAVRDGRLDEAVGLYGGEFLPDLAIPGGVEFEHWADVERQRVRSAFLYAARTTVRTWSSAGRHREAVGLARRVKDAESSEANLRLLLEALIAARDTISLTLEREAIERLFGGVENLETSTRALLRASRLSGNDTPERARESGLVAELVGREAEFRTLIDQWERARGGQARIVRVVAGAGLGKTRLLNDFAARLRANRAQVITLRARPADRLVAYSHAADLAASLAALEGAAAISPRNAAALVDLNPSLSSVFPGREERWRDGDDRFLHRVFATREIIAMVAEEAPVALLIDDHHWADEESRRLIAAVLPRLQHCGVMVVIASRPGYSEASITDALRLDLRPLTRAHTTALVSSLATLPEDHWAHELCDALHDGSGGSPLMVIEALQSLLERGFLRIDDGGWMTMDSSRLLDYTKSINAIVSRVGASSPEEQLVLGTLALYGAPATQELVTAAARLSPAVTSNVLARLESRGLVAGDGMQWWPAHDLHSESFSENLSAPERRRIERELGEHLARDEENESGLRRATQHFKASGARERMVDVFVRWLALRRLRGDKSSVRALMRGFDPELERTASWWHVPLALRCPQWRQIAAAAAVLLLVGVTASRINRTPAATPDGELIAWYDSGGVSLERRVALFRDRVINEGVVDMTRGPETRLPVAPASRMRLSPDGQYWTGDRVFPDSGGIDVVIMDRSMRAVRRISSKDDDLSPAWSPDGKQIVFATGRYHKRNWNDLAVYDVAAQSTRQLTSGDGIDAWPSWNPSGLSIAFERRDRGGGDPELCNVSADGSGIACTTYPGAHEVQPLDWFDDHRLVVAVKYDRATGPDRPDLLQLVDIADAAATKDLGRFPSVGDARLSPNHAWLACECNVTTTGVTRWTVFAMDNPDVRAELSRDRLDVQPMSIQWGPAGGRDSYIDVVSVPEITGGVPLNAAFSLRAEGTLKNGARVESVPVTWAITEGDAAHLDGSVLVPEKEGRVRVRANAGGWRSAEADMTIAPSHSTPFERVDWSKDFGSRWLPFGTPSPTVEREGVLGAVMLPNGDGSFNSGVLSGQGYEAGRGIAVRMAFSARVVDSQWQSLSVVLAEEHAGARWMTEPGDDASPTAERTGCAFGAPAGENPRMRYRATVEAGADSHVFPIDPSVTSGRTVNLLLQLFPDGSCGVALDGKPVFHLRSGRRGREKVRLVISGQSKDTRIWVGPVDLYRGVVPTIDWRAVGR
jgi:DNA-binding SARP family transcriptional activator